MRIYNGALGLQCGEVNDIMIQDNVRHVSKNKTNPN